MNTTNTPADPNQRPPAPRALVLLAFAIIYIVWGSTYLAIRLAVETLPPFFMGAGRFLIAGGILYAALRARGTPAPTRQDWGFAAVTGILLLGFGNGGVNWAERKVPSSLAALIIAGTPIWFACFEWIRPGGSRPGWRTVLGIGIGFTGVSLLIFGRSSAVSSDAATPEVSGLVALLLASMCWAAGSLYAKYARRTASTLLSAAQQMLAGGAFLIVMGLFNGDAANFHPSQVSSRSWLAFLYLTVAGSLVAFTAYAWLLTVASPTRISTYAYVNPVIAVTLGALWGEALTPSILVAASVIVAAVVALSLPRSVRIGSRATSAVQNDRQSSRRPLRATFSPQRPQRGEGQDAG